MNSLCKTKGLVRRLAVLALFAIMALVPCAAFAATTNPITATTTGAITVDGMKAGDTVKVYRIVETTYDATSNSISNAFAGEYGNPALKIDDYLGYATGSDDAKAAANTIAKAVAGTPATDTKTAAGDPAKAEFTGLAMGQYLVVVTPAADSTNLVYKATTVNLVPQAATSSTYKLDDATVSMKSQPLEIDKKAGGEERTEGYSVGDMVPFEVTVTVPEYPNDAINQLFKVSDVMSAGLKFNNDIQVYDADGKEITADSGAFEVTNVTATGYLVTFDYTNTAISSLAGSDITLKYTAELLNTAVPATDEENKATLEYANNANDENSHDKQTDEGKVGTFGIYLKKINKENEALKDAEFTVYRKAKTGETGVTVDGITGSVVAVGTITTGDDGMGSIKGLAKGEYYVKETKAPAGYVASNDVITITVNKDTAGSDEEADWYRYVNAGTITNNPQPILPVTGGPGTLALTGLGIVLIVGGIVVISRSRKRA